MMNVSFIELLGTTREQERFHILTTCILIITTFGSVFIYSNKFMENGVCVRALVCFNSHIRRTSYSLAWILGMSLQVQIKFYSTVVSFLRSYNFIISR